MLDPTSQKSTQIENMKIRGIILDFLLVANMVAAAAQFSTLTYDISTVKFISNFNRMIMSYSVFSYINEAKRQYKYRLYFESQLARRISTNALELPN